MITYQENDWSTSNTVSASRHHITPELQLLNDPYSIFDENAADGWWFWFFKWYYNSLSYQWISATLIFSHLSQLEPTCIHFGGSCQLTHTALVKFQRSYRQLTHPATSKFLKDFTGNNNSHTRPCKISKILLVINQIFAANSQFVRIFLKISTFEPLFFVCFYL